MIGIGTLLVAAGSFGAGVVTGVYLNDKGILTPTHLQRGAKWVVETARSEVKPVKPRSVPLEAKLQVVG